MTSFRNITSAASLKKAIEIQETEQTLKLQQLKDQFYPVRDSLKPANLFRSILKNISSSRFLVNGITLIATGLVTGYLSKTMIAGLSVNKARKLLGPILLFVVTNIMSRHADTIKSYFRNFLQRISHKKERISSLEE